MQLDQVTDLDTAKQMLALYEKENTRLQKQIEQLVREMARLKGHEDGEQLELEVTKLQEQLANLRQQVFGESSEKRPRKPEGAAPKPRRGHGPKPQPDIVRAEQLLELPEHRRTCEQCGEALEPIQGMTEDSEVITQLARRVVLALQQRQKYRCKTGCGIVTAAPVPKHIPGGRFDVAFAVQSAIDKYCDHMPLERQCRVLARQGLDVDSQTLWDQLDGLAVHLQPTYEALREYIVGADVVGADETWWRLMDKRGSKKWWAWGLTTHDASWYRIDESRSAKTAAQVLDGFSGTVLCDGYKAYETVANACEDLRLAHCWSHGRRKFVEAGEHYPAQVEPALDLIGKLFAIEAEMQDPAKLEGEEKQLAIQIRARRRDRESRPLIENLRSWALKQRASPKNAVRKAIEYMFSYWEGLTAFLDDPMLSIHNNDTERSLRGMVLGRKNHYGSRSKRGTEVAALMYSLVESAKLAGAEPYAYLLTLAKRAIVQPGYVLLPHDFVAEVTASDA